MTTKKKSPKVVEPTISTETVTFEEATVKKATKPVVKKPIKLPSFNNKIEKPNIYRLARHGGVDKQTGMRKYPVTYMIKAEDIIYDPETDSERTIRYIPGETSIYKDEQSKEAKLKEPIMFNHGQLIVDKTNPLLRQFMDMCNGNRSNPNRKKNKPTSFYKLDTEVNATKHVEKSKLEIESMHLALTMTIDKLIGYAKVLGVNTNKSSDEIRWDMKVLAQKDPKAFIDGMSDPTTEMKQIVLKAMDCSIIKLEKNLVSWVVGNSQQPICHVPIGIKPLDKMIDFCLTDDGELVYDELQKRLSRLS